MIYWIRSKQGKVVISFGFIILIGILIYMDFQRVQENPEDKPKAWRQLGSDGDQEPLQPEQTIDPKEFYGISKREDFEPLKAPIEFEEAPIYDHLKPEPENLSMPDDVVPSIIKFERKQDISVTEQDNAQSTLELPLGTLLYARLIIPIYSGNDESYLRVYGELTQALLLDGKTILERDTRFTGSVRRFQDGHARFENEWQFYLRNGETLSLRAMLQEQDYNAQARRYGFADGAPGLRMLPVSLEFEPEFQKYLDFAEELLRDIVRWGRYEMDYPELPDFHRWPYPGEDKGVTVEIDGSPDVQYFIPVATEFYLWAE